MQPLLEEVVAGRSGIWFGAVEDRGPHGSVGCVGVPAVVKAPLAPNIRTVLLLKNIP